ncbi:PaaI family thioesterase [Haloechinothrix sp. LS1_15]|uniref:PaaI family thioesterase n=1 Tax=Haloechinothrix sp. LS1_15 TaxID=2652248 RepID=UPI00294AD1D7|nr:PaaI family thioesterase [Haloechinothrix sp. LS1_15]
MESSGSSGRGVPGGEVAERATTADAEDLGERRAAVAELGSRLRELTEAAMLTEVAPEELRRVAAEAAELARALRQRRREVSEPASVDDFQGGVRMYNPVIGKGHPLAPPIRFEVDGAYVEGQCTLGAAHEGPPACSHGGMSALWVDQALGHAAAAVDNRGMTTHLSVRYRRPVPLEVPLRIWARATEVDGNRTITEGGITTVAEPDVELVAAEARFLRIDPDQARHMFPSMFDTAGSAGERG